MSCSDGIWEDACLKGCLTLGGEHLPHQCCGSIHIVSDRTVDRWRLC